MYVFDLDGTLSLVGERLNHLREIPPNWDRFYDRCGEDDINKPIATLYQSAMRKNGAVVITGRRESCRKATEQWFESYELSLPVHLLMRGNDDYRHDTIIKPELMRSIGLNTRNVDCIFEDRSSVVAEWRRLGFTCLQVAEGDF